MFWENQGSAVRNGGWGRVWRGHTLLCVDASTLPGIKGHPHPASRGRSASGPVILATLSHTGLGGKETYEELQVKAYEKQREDGRI